MIGRRELPRIHAEFNAMWGAPYGHSSLKAQIWERVALFIGSDHMLARARGPFGFQPDNNATRTVEYPWAFYAAPVLPGHRVVDVGGSLGGLQFVLSKQGAEVINVDPSDAASMGWPVDQKTIDLLNKSFGTRVELRKTFLIEAGIPELSIDRIYCISTIEHIPKEQIPNLLREMRRILKIGGLAILTIDLFFDLRPFTDLEANVHGTNIDVRQLVEDSGMRLSQGNHSELYGYPEFDPRVIQARAMEFFQGNIALNVAQTLVLTRES